MNKTNLILSILLAIGFLVRAVGIGTNPVSLYWDEASIGYESYSVSQTGKDMNGHTWLQAIYPAYGDYKAPMYIWLTSVTEKFLGPTPPAVRLPSAVFGTLTILVVFWLVLQLGMPVSTALFSAGALTFLPWHIQFSRTGFEANVAVFFIALCLLFALKSRQKVDVKNSLLSALCGTLAAYTYFSARIVVPLMILITLIVFGRNLKIIMANVSIWFTLFALALLPLYLSPYAKAADQIRLSADNITQNQADILYSNALSTVDEFNWFGRLVHHRYEYLAKALASNMASHFSADFLFFKGDPNPRHSTEFTGLMLPLMLPLFLLGIIGCLRMGKSGWYILGLWLIFLLPASVPREVPHALRSLNAVIPASLILGLGASTIYQWGKGTTVKRFVVISYSLLTAINFLTYTAYLQREYPVLSNLSWQDGYPQLAKYITSQYDHYDYLVVTPGDRLFLYVLFYGQYPPTFLHDQLEQQPRPPFDFSIKQIGKISFKPIVWADDKQGPSRSLLVGSPGDFPPEVPIKDTITDTRGTVQFVSVDLGNL